MEKINQQKNILIVDDEDSIRLSVNLLLSSYGYKTIEAKNGIEAIQIIEENNELGTDIDIVITDLEMPLMNGLDLVDYLNRNNYNSKIIIISGDLYSYKQFFLTQKKCACICKPFDADQLMEAISSTL